MQLQHGGSWWPFTLAGRGGGIMRPAGRANVKVEEIMCKSYHKLVWM